MARARGAGRAIRLLRLTDLLRDSLTKLAADVSRQYETLKPQKETVAAVIPLRVFHPSPRKNLSSLF